MSLNIEKVKNKICIVDQVELHSINSTKVKNKIHIVDQVELQSINSTNSFVMKEKCCYCKALTIMDRGGVPLLKNSGI